MASLLHASYGGIVALIFWCGLGLPIARRLIGPTLALPFAPLLGWAMHSAIAVPIFFVLPFSTFNITTVAVLSILASLFAAQADRRWGRSGTAEKPAPSTQHRSHGLFIDRDDLGIPVWALIAAAFLALASAAAIAPKHVGDAVYLSSQIFDHAKVSIINDMARLGLPPGNPFMAHDGGSGRLAYYYLWHFSAAELTRVLGITGWEADIAMTFFSAFTALSIMMTIAVKLSGRRMAAICVVALAASSSSRVLLLWLFGNGAVDAWLLNPGGFGGWLFQSSWVPQHLVSTSCVLCSIYLIAQLANRHSVLVTAVLALLIAAGFEASTWIGGVVFALACAVVVPLMLVQLDAAKRRGFVLALFAAVILSVALSSHFLLDQAAASALRQNGFPISIRAFPVLGDAISSAVRQWLDLPAYWLVLLPIELTAVYMTGMAVLFQSLTLRELPVSSRRNVTALVALAITSLLIAGLLVSTLADNNDLAWRAVFMASTVLIVFAAVGLASWIESWIGGGRQLAAILTIGTMMLGVPGAIQQIAHNVTGNASAQGQLFAAAPSLWAAVRAHSSPTERIANNPRAMQQMTPWPVNISWGLLADRRSCYPGWELAQVYTSIPHDQLRAVDTKFEHIFAGDASQEDIKELATTYDCSVVVVTPEDGAWTNDPFPVSTQYGLVEEVANRWRIYRRVTNQN